MAMDSVVDSSIEARARALGELVVAASVGTRDAARSWDAGLFRRLGELGVLCPGLPAAHGGGGYLPLAEARHFVGLARGSLDAGLCHSIAAHAHGCAAAIDAFGNEAMRERHLRAMARGHAVGALAHRDPIGWGPETESDARVPGVRAAVASEGCYRLDGSKASVANGPVADVFVVTAVLEGADGSSEAAAFVIERDTPGLRVGPPVETAGLRTASISDVFLEGCVVSESQRLGASGQDSSRVVRTILLREQSLALAPWAGLMRALLERALAHAKQARGPAGALSSSQHVRAAIADIWIRVELAERMMQRAAHQLVFPGPTPERDAASSTLLVVDALAHVARGVDDVLGRAGLAMDPVVERLGRDAAVLLPLREESGRLRSVLAGTILAQKKTHRDAPITVEG